MSTQKKMHSDPKTTLLVITVGMILVYTATRMNWALVTALVVGISGLASGFLAAKIDWLWMKLTYVLSLIVPNILLSAVFYLILTPIAILSRVFGKSNPLDLKNNSASYFKEHAGKLDKASFEKPW